MRTKRVSLLSKEAVEKLRKEKFSGKISVSWERGVINDFDFKDMETPSLSDLEIDA